MNREVDICLQLASKGHTYGVLWGLEFKGRRFGLSAGGHDTQ